jgi:glutamine amidotransferase
MTLVVLDYGIGNLRSAEKAFEQLGVPVRRVADPSDLPARIRGVVLPGVGAFGAAARALRESGLERVVLGALDARVPFLGICVGLQLLFEGSEEDPGVPGLGLLAGRVVRLPEGVRHPQMQWNLVTVPEGRRSALLASGAPSWFYFVHSFVAEPVGGTASEVVTGVCDYGGPMTALVEHDGLAATQFHPEKSGRAGLEVLRRFSRLCGYEAVLGEGGRREAS